MGRTKWQLDKLKQPVLSWTFSKRIRNVRIYWVILLNVQRNATICSLYVTLLQDHSTCFGCLPHPSSGVHKSVVTATDTSYMFVQLPHSSVAKLATLEWGSCTTIWLVPEAVVTVLCTPDYGCGTRPKHVGWFCSKITYWLRIVSSRWTCCRLSWNNCGRTVKDCRSCGLRWSYRTSVWSDGLLKFSWFFSVSQNTFSNDQ